MTEQETICQRCGEPLIGSVNRCWKCRSPVEVIPVAHGATDLPPEGKSPFSHVTQSLVHDTDHESRSLVDGTAIAAVIIGVFALSLSWWTSLALFPATIGLGCGIWSLGTGRRQRWKTAGVGCLLCLLAVAVGGKHVYHNSLIWYQDRYVEDEF